MQWVKQEEITPAQMGINGATLSATTNGNWIECRHGSQLTLEVDITNATAAALPLVFYIDTQRFGEASTVVRYTMSLAPGIPAAGEVNNDIYRNKYTYTTAAVAASYRLSFELPLTCQAFRVSGVTAAGAGATDLVSIHARVGY